jgi:thymidylate synthase ThyX
MIKAKILADSKNGHVDRITTMIVTFPRIILAELDTHRMFSRNSASSRAIPFERMVKSVEENPFIPIAWQKDHKGMQGTEYFDTQHSEIFKSDWLFARSRAIDAAETLNKQGVTKQLANRLLEPFMYHTVIITATEWENFFKMCCPRYQIEQDILEGVFRSKKDYIKASREQNNSFAKVDDYTTLNWLEINKGQAEIHMMALAEAMWDAYTESKPELLEPGHWHIPYNKEISEMIFKEKPLTIAYPEDLLNVEVEGTDDEVQSTSWKVKVSTMMCARTSYTTISDDLKPWNFNKYIEKYNELIDSDPIHSSPLEHCAQCMTEQERKYYIKGILIDCDARTDRMEDGRWEHTFIPDEANGWCDNFRGFISHRRQVEAVITNY